MTPNEVKCQRNGCYLGRHLKYRGRFFCSSRCSELYFGNTEDEHSEVETQTESDVEIGSEIESSDEDEIESSDEDENSSEDEDDETSSEDED